MTYKMMAATLGALVLAGSVALGGPAASAVDIDVDGWAAPNGGVTIEDGALVLDQNDADAGVSIERDLDGTVADDLAVSFSLMLVGDAAACGGGAPRVFMMGGALYGQLTNCDGAKDEYIEVGLDDLTWWSGGTQYADWAAAVGGNSGKALGHVGLVFDNAAGQDARAYFKNLVLFDDEVDLTTPPTTTPTADPSTSASPSASAVPSASGSPSHSTPASATATPSTSGGPILPVTGTSVVLLVGIGLTMVGAGSLLLLARRRRDVEA